MDKTSYRGRDSELTHFAIILEWENALACGLDRPIHMLRQLDNQVRGYAREHDVKIDLIVVFNSQLVDATLPRNCASEQLDLGAWPGVVEFLDVPSKSYYELKNAGAKHTDAQAFIFLDSDVIPQPNWLSSLLDAIRIPGAKMVGGNTYVDCKGLTDKAFAAFWTFPPREKFNGVEVRGHFWANNIAFRTEFFLSNPFPTEDCYRGQCAALARTLGNQIPTHGRAWVSHPAPNGIFHILNRALCKGYDQAYWSRRGGNCRTGLLGPLRRFARDSINRVSTVNQRKRSLGLSHFEVGWSYVVAVSYTFVSLVGELVTLVSPRSIRERIPTI